MSLRFLTNWTKSLRSPGIGTVIVDTAYGGGSIVLVDAKSVGFAIFPDEARKLAETGTKIYGRSE